MAKNEINRGSPDLEYSDEEVLNYHENNYPGHGKIEIIPKLLLSLKEILH